MSLFVISGERDWKVSDLMQGKKYIYIFKNVLYYSFIHLEDLSFLSLYESVPCIVVLRELLSCRLHCSGSVGSCGAASVPGSVFCSAQKLKIAFQFSGAVTSETLPPTGNKARTNQSTNTHKHTEKHRQNPTNVQNIRARISDDSWLEACQIRQLNTHSRVDKSVVQALWTSKFWVKVIRVLFVEKTLPLYDVHKTKVLIWYVATFKCNACHSGVYYFSIFI